MYVDMCSQTGLGDDKMAPKPHVTGVSRNANANAAKAHNELIPGSGDDEVTPVRVGSDYIAAVGVCTAELPYI